MADFFISYTQADKAWAEWIAWTLEANGYTTLVQAWDIRPGSNFVVEMHNAAQNAARTLIVLSPAYLEANRRSGFTTAEWAAAFKADPDGRQRKLLPVRVAECDPPGLLGPLVYLDLVGLPENEARVKLLTGAKPGRGKPAAAPGFPGGSERALQPQPAAAPAFPGVNVQGRGNVVATGGSIAIGGDVHGDIKLG
ncbi:MAG: toll/interleukin-1 receptor domain-containing protein [Chloroflexota bacterium]